MTPRLVCLGNLTIDDVVLPSGEELAGCIGGDALYAALAARLIEPSAEMVAPLGRDFPRAVLDRVAAAGMSFDGLVPRPEATLHNRVVYRADGGRDWTLYSSEDDFHALSPRPGDVPASFRSAAGFLVLAMTLEAQEALVSDLEGTGATIALDPQEDYIAGHEDRLKRLIAMTDVFMPSAEEARRLLGHGDWDRAARTFADWGPGIVVVKLGAEGCLVHERDAVRSTRVPACPAVAVDTTGAGDSFCGAFMAALVGRGADPVAAARAGAAAASIAVEGWGVEPLFDATAEQISARLASAG